MKEFGIIVVYLGRLPEYFHHFLAGCIFNSHIDWILFTDQIKTFKSGENIYYNYLDINAFNKIATEKLEFPVHITNAYKFCDFKPVYGLIFEDFLKDYNYWGYCDIDMVLGNFGKFLTYDNLRNYDIISAYERFLSGPFCLYKNNETTKNLFMTCPDYKFILQNTSHLAFDENISGKNLKRFSFKKSISFINFLLKEIHSLKKYNFSFVELRYNFQWDFKQKNMTWKYPTDMTEAVFMAIQNRTLNACFSHLLYSDRFYKRIKWKNWNIKWESGILTEAISGQEIFAFHFPDSKKSLNFKIDTYDHLNNHFSISESGIKNV